MKLLVLLAIVLIPTMASSSPQFRGWTNNTKISGHEGDSHYSGDDRDPASSSLRGRDNVGNIEVISHYHFHKYILQDGDECVHKGGECDGYSKCCEFERSLLRRRRKWTPLECRDGTCQICGSSGASCTFPPRKGEPRCCPQYACIASTCSIPNG